VLSIVFHSCLHILFSLFNCINSVLSSNPFAMLLKCLKTFFTLFNLLQVFYLKNCNCFGHCYAKNKTPNIFKAFLKMFLLFYACSLTLMSKRFAVCCLYGVCLQLRFAYYMRGHHVFQLTLHVMERPHNDNSDSSDVERECRGEKMQNFTNYWSKLKLTTTSRATAAKWTTVSTPLPQLRCP